MKHDIPYDEVCVLQHRTLEGGDKIVGVFIDVEDADKAMMESVAEWAGEKEMSMPEGMDGRQTMRWYEENSFGWFCFHEGVKIV